MSKPLSEPILLAAEAYLNAHPEQIDEMRAAAAKAIGDLTELTRRYWDSDCETFADWLWILENETGDTANDFGEDSLVEGTEAEKAGKKAAVHGFAVVGTWLTSFPTTWDAKFFHRSALSQRYGDFLCRLFSGHELTMTNPDPSRGFWD
jgi:hypothetical protein